MFSRLSRYLIRRNEHTEYTPLPAIPPQIPVPFDPHPRSLTASSGICTGDPDHVPSFLQLINDDSQRVYCMETVPLYKPSSLPPETRKANSIYDRAQDEILSERKKVISIENTEEENQLEMRYRMVSARRDDRMRPWNSIQHSMAPSRRNRYQPSFEERERDVYDYTSGDHYYGPPIYRDPPSSQHSQHRLNSSHSSVGYVERDYSPNYDLRNHHQPRLPIPPAPFRRRHQPSFPLEHFPQQYPQRRDSIQAEPYFGRESSFCQGPYHLSQCSQTPLSSYHHPDFYYDVGPDQLPYYNDDVPMTRVTRLKEPGKTFRRADEMKTDAGGISVMIVSQRDVLRTGTKSNVGVGTHNTPIRLSPQNSIKEAKSLTTLFPSTDTIAKKNSTRSTRASPRTLPRVIKIGKYAGRYKTSTMPAYTLTTSDTDSETSSISENKLLLPRDFISSSPRLATVTEDFDRTNETDKWLQMLVNPTFSDDQESVKPQQMTLERKNTIDVKRYRVYSTSVGVQPRDIRRTPTSSSETLKRNARQGIVCDEISSWIASEIFNIAKAQAAESDLQPTKSDEEKKELLENETLGDDGYDDIASLMGDYFEDIKITGSDCGED